MRRENVLATVAGFAFAALVLAGLFWLVGFQGVLAAIARARLPVVGLVALASVLWLLSWGVTLRIVLGTIGVQMSAVKASLVYAAAAFANNVTPFGQAGGEPITALLITDVSDAELETGLAGIASVDALNFVPSITLAVLGVAFYASEATLTGRLELLSAAVLVLALASPVVAVLAWSRRYAIEEWVITLVAPVLRAVGRVVPRVSIPTPEDVRRRVEGFFNNVERIATSPRNLALSLLFSTAGWVMQALGLWLTVVALGETIPFYVALFVIPLGTMASVLPTPGGLGGIETVHVALLTLATPVGGEIAAAAVTIFRVGGFLFVTTLGGAAMGVLRVREGGRVREA